jgi:uncharacterized protein with HEPN domain
VSRDSDVYLEDMLQAARRILDYSEGMDGASLAGDPRTFDAIVRNLIVIGEAAKRVPDDVRRRALEIDWRKVCGLRDVLVHDYQEIDVAIVWDIVCSRIPGIARSMEKLLQR